MDMKEEMMSDAVDDVMDEGLEDEEEEGDKILKQVLDEIGVDLSQQVRFSSCNVTHLCSFVVQLADAPTGLAISSPLTESRQAVPIGEGGPSGDHSGGAGGGSSSGGGGGGGMSDEDALQARLDALRRG